ncbi:crisp subfamily glioma pathogenesis-related protein-related [Clonorchis sinensis]|uniref:Crisp subfamily glioma pathogenesis-related protein-related n=1 Tax=Clonorchis sinensis TaxID=79923 RepID=H2KVQ2_CLOSI|nr:crisp subfamily glioma pathogenesis-related protein-related [Clonorchis sinensis]
MNAKFPRCHDLSPWTIDRCGQEYLRIRVRTPHHRLSSIAYIKRLNYVLPRIDNLQAPVFKLNDYRYIINKTAFLNLFVDTDGFVLNVNNSQNAISRTPKNVHQLHFILRNRCVLLLFFLGNLKPKLFVELHNDGRLKVQKGEVPGHPCASYMPRVVGLNFSFDRYENYFPNQKWDTGLARKAQKWANKCRPEHDNRKKRRTTKFRVAGQNWAIGYDLETQVEIAALTLCLITTNK